MSSAIQTPYTSNPPRQPVHHAPPGNASMHAAAAPAGTFSSGTKVQVGASRVIIDRYLSEGGFAHVYLVKLPKAVGGTDRAVLKRVAVPDKEALANMRTEVETMKKLKGHRQIVTYFDSHASQLNGGGFEVFLLMEYCSGGGLIDFMNTRLQNRLTEPEILKIFSDTAQGVACMHYLKPPLLHRDLKVENILISDSGSSKQFKLCDFGSAAPPRPAATTAAEGRLIEEDVQKHTTIQYRSPEMIDVYRKQPIDEKSDIWALGVLLYKLCYYTTPFEEQGQMAILNASFRYPAYPQFSDKIKLLIAKMLQEKPQRRPNIYQVVEEVCSMRGTECPIKDIYTGRSASEARRNQELPPTPGQIASPPVVGAFKAVHVEEKVVIPEITPMRRGRPTSNLGGENHGVSAKPSPSPRRQVVSGDPFAALDSNSNATKVQVDELSSRFPSLDHFSLLHESGGTFQFDQSTAPKLQHKRELSSVNSSAANQSKDISQRVTEVLADEAFALPAAKAEASSRSMPINVETTNNTIGTQTIYSPPPKSESQKPQRPAMVSTGTMTSDSSPPPRESSSSQKPIFRFPPNEHRSSSQPRPGGSPNLRAMNENQLPIRPSLQDHRSKSQIFTSSKSSTSSRPSLESSRPNPNELIGDSSQYTNASASSRARPVSTHLETATNFVKRRSLSRGKDSTETDYSATPSTSAKLPNAPQTSEDHSQLSNVEFLKAMETEDNSKRKEKRLSSSANAGVKHSKRSSLPSMSLSGTKNLLAGRFGEAFRRFETNGPQPAADIDDQGFPDSVDLTPIAGSEATDGRSDDGFSLSASMMAETETEEMSPEMRRELERQQLAQEERRVADAAARYKQGLSPGIPGKKESSSGRAESIQNKVQALLDESQRPSQVTKTAEGYGRFTSSPTLIQQVQHGEQSPRGDMGITPKVRQTEVPLRQSATASAVIASQQGSVTQGQGRPAAPPGPKPKPQALRSGGTGGPLPPVASKPTNLLSNTTRAGTVQGQARGNIVGLGVSNGGHQHHQAGPVAEIDEDWETTFSKKYPSLDLEMVETEISAGTGREKIVRDV